MTGFLYIIFIMFNQLELFTSQGCELPTALVSRNASDLVKSVVNKDWAKTSSGLGSHTYVESSTITDPDELQEYWEEYSL